MRRAGGPHAVALAALLACAGVVAAATPPRAPRHADGPPAGHTGGFGEPTCLACHTEAPLNPPGGRLTLEGWPAAYEPGRTYPLTIVLESEQMGAAGFQLAVRSASGAPAGELSPVDGRVALADSAGVSYAQHAREGTTVADPSRVSWRVDWTAPRSGEVRAHVAANSANGDDSPLGDFIYAESFTSAPAPTR